MQDARAYTRLHPADGPEDRSVQERCLLSGTTGPPKGVLASHSWLYSVASANGFGLIGEPVAALRLICSEVAEPGGTLTGVNWLF